MSVKEKRNLVDPYAYIKAAAAITIFCYHLKVFSSLKGYVITEANWYMRTAAHGAVWIFFFLSGYFNICGFLGDNPKYSLDPRGILNFYAGRFFKVLLPVWCFCLIALVISEPAFIHLYPRVILRLLTFTYTGEPGCTSIAATWYVSTLAWLYIFTPFMAWICRGLEKRQGKLHLILFFVAVASLGFAERMFFLWKGTNWTQGVFVPPYCNIDIYLCGACAFLLADRIKLSVSGRTLYVSAIALFSLLLTVHTRINFLSDTYDLYVMIHEYIMPTVCVIIMTIVCILIRNTGYSYLPVSVESVRKNPLRLIDAFSLISFQFYLVHSMVLFHLSQYTGGDDGFQYNRRLFLSGFIISALLSVLLKKATAFKVPKFDTSVGNCKSKDTGGIS